ncbi:hypothetical protein AAMO2058_001456500 [Amorphochlora amoebiformis]
MLGRCLLGLTRRSTRLSGHHGHVLSIWSRRRLKRFNSTKIGGRDDIVKILEKALESDQDLGRYIGAKLKGKARGALADGLIEGGTDTAFNLIDKDGDEKITIRELKTAFFGQTGGESVSRQDFKKMFPMLRAGRGLEVNATVDESDTEGVKPPSLTQLTAVGVQASIPFLIFGFLDNFIMILAGDMIDAQIGAALNLSVMASAALGNTVSDFIGQTAGGAIGQTAERLGWPDARLTDGQASLKISKRTHQFGTVVGIIVGCLLGMVPLLFMESKQDKTLRKAFGLLDEDGDGVVDQQNLEDAFRRVGLIEPEWVAELIIHETNGPFDFQEFREQFRKAVGWLIMNQKCIDLSGDVDVDILVGMIRDLLQPTFQRSKTHWTELFGKVDKRNAGRISTIELVEIFCLLHNESENPKIAS